MAAKLTEIAKTAALGLCNTKKTKPILADSPKVTKATTTTVTVGDSY
jgi:hypothetical protein